jgi:alkylhydroperoxidase/carboxymuconolactone decarboxylase family protein YurZ
MAAPATGAAWAGLCAPLERDGALPAADKALILIAVATTRGRPALLERELARLEALGGRERLASLYPVLTLARGREAAEALAAAAGEALDWPPVGEAPSAAEVDAARGFLAPGGGSEPPPVALLAEHAPAALVGYRGLRGAVYEESGLEGALIELVLFAVMAADYAADHAAVHASRATAAGAGEGQLVEAALCAVAAAGMGSWLIAAAAIDGV